MGRPRSELVLRDDPPAPGVPPPRWEREEAFGVLFRKHAEGLIRLAYCLLGDRESAEDAVQEAYLSLYRNWDRLRDQGSSHAYLRAAVINRSRPGRAS